MHRLFSCIGGGRARHSSSKKTTATPVSIVNITSSDSSSSSSSSSADTASSHSLSVSISLESTALGTDILFQGMSVPMHLTRQGNHNTLTIPQAAIPRELDKRTAAIILALGDFLSTNPQLMQDWTQGKASLRVESAHDEAASVPSSITFSRRS